MHECQISLAELMGRERESQKITEDRVPKCHALQSGVTWSGRGRAPHRIVDKNQDDFLARA
jgi:DNA-binding protein H-NS